QARKAVGARRDKLLIVGVIRETEYCIRRRLDHALRGAVRCVPEPDGAALVARGDLGAVVTPRDGLDVGGMAVERFRGGRRGAARLPEAQGLTRSKCDPLAVRARRQRMD